MCLVVLLFVIKFDIKAENNYSYIAGGKVYGFFDNREIKSDLHLPQTMYGVRFVPYASFYFESNHSVTIGASLLKEFGSSPFVDKAHPYLYYNYAGENFDFFIWFFSP
ncbi:hypothetical protein QA597_02775 [Marinilabiliaceae bacterium ANBcel2]|nr:hypothetical protein [Marinilabiliaceae bacterium ANBcel2]